MQGTKYTSKKSILERAKEAIGIPLRDIDTTGRLATGKGAVGTVVEESWFGYSPNSESEPDFPEAGVELKVIPYLRGKAGIHAKERLVCNIIDYNEEYKKTFRTSSFWHKCQTILLMVYENIKDCPKGDYMISKALLFTVPDEDLAIMEHDWQIIMDKIRAGRAHEISEGDTMYLGACTKGATAEKSLRSQPFSDIKAKQRAYSLKQSYVSQILQKYVFGTGEDEHIIRSVADLRQHSFEDLLIEKLRPYYGYTQAQLKERFNVVSAAKNLNGLLLSKMLGLTGHITGTDEFRKAGLIPKTIRIQRNGRIKESIPFPAFDFIKLSKETSWEDSELYSYLAPAKFMFVIFQETGAGDYVFSHVLFWNIPNTDLEEVRKVWERTVCRIREGVSLIPTSRGMSNDLPKASENPVCHVRPHARDARDRLPLPDGRMMTKQCFWLNNTYIEKQIKELGNVYNR